MSDNRPTREECEAKQLAEHEPQFDVGERVVFVPFPGQRGAVTECDVFGSVTVALDDGCTGHFPIRDLVAECCLREYDKTAAVEKVIRGSGYSTHPEDICQECGSVNVVWFAPNNIWSAVVGSEAGILCLSCFIQKADTKGLYQGGGWRLSQEYQEGQCDELRSENANLKRDKERLDDAVHILRIFAEHVAWVPKNIVPDDRVVAVDLSPTADNPLTVGDFRKAGIFIETIDAAMESTASEGASKA